MRLPGRPEGLRQAHEATGEKPDGIEGLRPLRQRFDQRKQICLPHRPGRSESLQKCPGLHHGPPVRHRPLQHVEKTPGLGLYVERRRMGHDNETGARARAVDVTRLLVETKGEGSFSIDGALPGRAPLQAKKVRRRLRPRHRH
jgi:hypothetical protein